jgi:hypothetical protein
MPRVFSTREGNDYHLDAEDNFWRAISYVNAHSTTPSATSASTWWGGACSQPTSDLPIEQPPIRSKASRYLGQWRLRTTKTDSSPTPNSYCLDFVEQRRAFAHPRRRARAGQTTPRACTVTKVNNVMKNQQDAPSALWTSHGQAWTHPLRYRETHAPDENPP